MAHFYPTSAQPGTPNSETKTWRALENLPDSWRVFHSVAWQVPKRNRILDGEADFVLIHPKHGMIVLEVKGGLLEVRRGEWYQRDVDGGDWRKLSQSPHDQAKGAMYDLRRYLVDRVDALGELPATRAIVLPAVSHPGTVGLDQPSEMTISKDELIDVPAAIDKLIAYAKLDADLTKDQLHGITQLLAPTIRLRTRIGTELAVANEAIIELTDQQIRVLDLLRRHRRALITGGAGTGKTILALERARRLAGDGARVLLTCYNRPLGDHLAADLSDIEAVTAKSFHAFARRQIGLAGLIVPDEPSQEWYTDGMPEMLAVAAERLDLSFDAIVVDEGQDFTPSWFTALQMLLEDPDDGPFYVFTDLNQSIYVEEWESPVGDEPYQLDINCRNTNQIAAKVSAVIGEEPLTLGVDGMAPRFILASNDEEIREILDEAVGRMVGEERVAPSQITILGDSRSFVEDLQGSIIGGTSVGDLDSPGVVAETIHRFKGLENDVVIVALHEVETEQQRRLAYIGMSRAKGLLIVVGSKHVKRAIGW